MSRKEWAENGEAFQMSLRDGKPRNALDVLSMPDIELRQIQDIVRAKGQQRGEEQFASFEVSPLVFETVEATGKYCNYLSRQEDEMEKMRKGRMAALPADLVYSRENFPSFSSEELEQLSKHRPETLHAASLIQGVTPHTVIYLQNHIMKRRHRKNRLTDASQSGEDLLEATQL